MYSIRLLSLLLLITVWYSTPVKAQNGIFWHDQNVPIVTPAQVTAGLELVFVKYGWLYPTHATNTVTIYPNDWWVLPASGGPLRRVVMPHPNLPGFYWVR